MERNLISLHKGKNYHLPSLQSSLSMTYGTTRFFSFPYRGQLSLIKFFNSYKEILIHNLHKCLNQKYDVVFIC